MNMQDEFRSNSCFPAASDTSTQYYILSLRTSVKSENFDLNSDKVDPSSAHVATQTPNSPCTHQQHSPPSHTGVNTAPSNQY